MKATEYFSVVLFFVLWYLGKFAANRLILLEADVDDYMYM